MTVEKNLSLIITLLVLAGYSLGRCLAMGGHFTPPGGHDCLLFGGVAGLLVVLSFFCPATTLVLYSVVTVSSGGVGYIVSSITSTGVYDTQSASTPLPFIPVVVQKIGAYWVRFMVYLLTLGIYYIIVVPYSLLVFMCTDQNGDRVEWVQEEETDYNPNKPF